MNKYMPAAGTLLYGAGGAGKTGLAVSAFWDWMFGKPVADGKLISFGAEDNPALEIPEEFRQTQNGTSLRLTSPLLDSTEFLQQFDLITRKLIYDAENGDKLDVLVIDGLSEFDLLYEHTFDTGDDEKGNFAKWDGLLNQMFSMMLRIMPSVLGCAVITTARVMEKKKSKQSGKTTMAGDPGWMDFDYYPSLRGSFRLHLPHYFQNVFYMETVPEQAEDGQVIPGHATHLITQGEYLTKCQWEHKLLKAGLTRPVVNLMWPESWAMLTQAIDTKTQGEA